MPKEKFVVGEKAEVKCAHLANGRVVEDWLTGTVVEADHRMAAIQFTADVFSSNGWRIPDRILWCAHGSPNIRRPTTKDGGR
ncbi:MAG: hypothetical protein FJ030_08220 [Chloroflexi bacterium]|nr:hypothetical protein [Chloroflexota bacterium]